MQKSLQNKIEEINEKAQQEMDQLERENMPKIETKQEELSTRQSQYTLKDSQLNEKKKLEEQIVQLEKDLEQEKKDRIAEISDKEREKIRDIEDLKLEMKNKIGETRANLKALNDEQLQTTTRLTILQNHQLTTELEYQSKQTEKLLNKNNKMQDQISSLKRDIELHKEIEAELAKKFHRSQKRIKKMNEEVKKFENDLSALKVDTKEEEKHQEDNAKNSEELINAIEHRLGEVESKLTSTESSYYGLQAEYNRLQDLLYKSKDKYKKAALICTDVLEDLLNSNPNILSDQTIDKLPKEDKIKQVEHLLKLIQPYLSTYNLSVDPPELKLPPIKGSKKITGSKKSLYTKGFP